MVGRGCGKALARAGDGCRLQPSQATVIFKVGQATVILKLGRRATVVKSEVSVEAQGMQRRGSRWRWREERFAEVWRRRRQSGEELPSL